MKMKIGLFMRLICQFDIRWFVLIFLVMREFEAHHKLLLVDNVVVNNATNNNLSCTIANIAKI